MTTLPTYYDADPTTGDWNLSRGTVGNFTQLIKEQKDAVVLALGL